MEQEIQVLQETLEQEITIENENIGVIPTGTKTITENGIYDISKYKNADVNVPQPTGTINITQNGETNVRDYEIANVNVPEPTGTLDITINGNYNVKNYEFANVNTPVSLDWTALGYSGMPQSIQNGYDYALEVKNNWQNVSSLTGKFSNNLNLKYMPLVDTSNATNTTQMFSDCTFLENVPLLNTAKVTNFVSMFSYCRNLETIPQLDTSKGQSFGSMFNNCAKLKNIPVLNFKSVGGTWNMGNMFANCTLFTDETLDNILKSCMTATSVSGTKTLSTIGFRSSDYPASRIQALPSYQDFINAGWTIGY